MPMQKPPSHRQRRLGGRVLSVTVSNFCGTVHDHTAGKDIVKRTQEDYYLKLVLVIRKQNYQFVLH